MNPSLHIGHFYLGYANSFAQFFFQDEITEQWHSLCFRKAVYYQPWPVNRVLLDTLFKKGGIQIGVQNLSELEIPRLILQDAEDYLSENEGKILPYCYRWGNNNGFFVIASQYEQESIGIFNDSVFAYYSNEANQSKPNREITLPGFFSVDSSRVICDFKQGHFFFTLKISLTKSNTATSRVIRFENCSEHLLVSIGYLGDILSMTWEEFYYKDTLFFKITNPKFINDKMGSNFQEEVYVIGIGWGFVFLLEAKEYNIYDNIKII